METKMPTLEKGRPADCTGRLAKEIKTYDLLDRLGIEYERIDHEPLFTIEACREVDRALGVEICKNLLLTNKQQTEFYMLVMPGSKRFETKVVSKALGVSRLSFASGDRMVELLDITPGSLTVFGLPNDTERRVTLVIDRDVLGFEHFAAHPCINTSSLKLRTGDLMDVYLPAIGRQPIII